VFNLIERKYNYAILKNEQGVKVYSIEGIRK
jgi:hypothetical protein